MEPLCLIGKAAPDFTAQAVMPNNEINSDFNLSNYHKGKNCVLFFYPLDFTFVCPSELIAFNKRLEEFESRNTKVVAVSVDSQYSHLAYKNTPVAQGGIGNVQYPMVADLTKNIARNYGVLLEGAGVAFRGTVLIDIKGVVRHLSINDLPLGRNVDEVLRMVDALNFYEENGEVCPAGWQKGKPAMKASTEGVSQFLAANAESL